jgi:hypothetical protein
MDTPAYDIVFSGILIAGHDPAQVRVELARLFKTDASGIERLFCGQPVFIKRSVDRQTADKYRVVLEKAGAVCEIRTHTAANSAAAAPGRMTVAPAGMELTAQKQVTPPVFDLGHMSLVAAGADILAGVDTVVAAPLFDLSAFTLAPPGSELVAASRTETPSMPNMSALSVAEPGTDLDVRRPAAAVALPDISAITLAPAGTVVLRPEEAKPRPEPPDIAGHHLTLESTGGSAR